MQRAADFEVQANMLTLFVTFESAPPASAGAATGTTAFDAASRVALIEQLRRMPGLAQGVLGTPADGLDTPFKADRPLPLLTLQLYFESVQALEGALGRGGALHAMAHSPGAWPALAHAAVTHQAMIARPFAVPASQGKAGWGTDPGAPACGLLVHYPGPAQDTNAWLRHYLQHHTPLLAKFSGIRDVEVCTRIDWCDDAPAWRRVDHMQRNRVVFDSGEALVAALKSPLLDELRADSRALPPFAGGSRHYAMWLWRFEGTDARSR
ncbi:MAG: EthD family reductase [Burkholderiaceae bacterium]